jgi:septum formation inhibitor-activating ATPase MinD
VTTIDLAVQLVGVAVVPLNVTEPVVPKLFPAIVTDAPAGPAFGDRLVMLGGGSTVIVVEPQIEPMQALTVEEPVATATALP